MGEIHKCSKCRRSINVGVSTTYLLSCSEEDAECELHKWSHTQELPKRCPKCKKTTKWHFVTTF